MNSGPMPIALIALPTVRLRIKPAAIRTATRTREVTSKTPADFETATTRGACSADPVSVSAALT